MQDLLKIFKNFYWQLFFVFALISIIGIVYIYSASNQFSYGVNSFAFKQTVWLFLAFFVIFFVNFVGYFNCVVKYKQR